MDRAAFEAEKDAEWNTAPVRVLCVAVRAHLMDGGKGLAAVGSHHDCLWSFQCWSNGWKVCGRCVLVQCAILMPPSSWVCMSLVSLFAGQYKGQREETENRRQGGSFIWVHEVSNASAVHHLPNEKKRRDEKRRKKKVLALLECWDLRRLKKSRVSCLVGSETVMVERDGDRDGWMDG